jgi:DNA-binding NarL/FixJ family response regulator
VINLTEPQLKVVRLLATGRTFEEIAKEVEAPVKMVRCLVNGCKKHVKNNSCCVFHRLGFSGIAQLTHWAIRHGVVELGEALPDWAPKNTTSGE